jgi:hypothetical protein
MIDYQDAVQEPQKAFTDPDLRIGKVAVSPLGLPLPLSGGFALTYEISSGSRKYAVRCFHHEVPEVQVRYSAISTKLRSLATPYFVNFDFQAQGIRIRGKPYPVVKMDWVEGETLGIYLDRAATNAASVSALRQAFVNLADFLQRSGIAHGDIQNENVMVSRGALRLIDYDGMFVEGLPEGRGTEVGHRHFQHPARETKDFGPKIDRFSFIVLDVSLEALQIDASLHRRFREGGLAIIFKASDFADPSSSEIFRVLNGMPALRESARKLAAICGAPMAGIPTLTDFIAGRDIPSAVKPPLGAPTKPAPPSVYIGAYDVVAAQDFNAVNRRVGDKVELVGQIVSVKEGIGKRGKGRGRPYVFVNFGVWNQNSAKITIWSEGLGKLNSRPTAAWVGRWISVTGLIEPPYEGKHYGRPYSSVGITVTSDSQIIQIPEQDAKYRLGGASRPSNADILNDIQSRSGDPQNVPRKPGQVRPSPKFVSSKTKNEQILARLRTPTSGGLAKPQPHLLHPPPSSNPLSHIPAWVWIVGVLLALLLLGRR